MTTSESDNTGIFKNYLTKNEEILWVGKPLLQEILKYSDFLKIPLNLLIGGLFVYLGTTIGYAGLTKYFSFIKYQDPITWLFIIPFIYSILFVLLGFYIGFGRFIISPWQRKNTYYAVTNRRVLVLHGLKNKHLTEIYIETNINVNYQGRKDDIGNIEITVNKPIPKWTFFSLIRYWKTNWLGFSYTGYPGQIIFYDIKNVREIYNLIQDLRIKAT